MKVFIERLPNFDRLAEFTIPETHFFPIPRNGEEISFGDERGIVNDVLYEYPIHAPFYENLFMQMEFVQANQVTTVTIILEK